MSDSQWIGAGAPSPTEGGTDAQTLQAALLRMTPEERAAMFEPFQDELSGLDRQAQPQQHTTAGGALFGGLANMFANMDRKDALKRMQADANTRVNARYGLDASQEAASIQRAQAAALRGNKDPFGLPALTLGE